MSSAENNTALCAKHWNANLRLRFKKIKERKKKVRHSYFSQSSNGHIKASLQSHPSSWDEVAFNIPAHPPSPCIPVRSHFLPSSVPMQTRLRRSKFRENPASSGIRHFTRGHRHPPTRWSSHRKPWARGGQAERRVRQKLHSLTLLQENRTTTL